MAPCAWLVTTSSCHNVIVPPFRHVIRRPFHLATCHTIPPCYLPPTWRTYVAVPPGAPPGTPSGALPCHLVRHRDTTIPPWHLVRHRDTTLPPCHLVHHKDTTAPPCRPAAAVPTGHIGVFPYTHAPDSCQSYLRTSWHCLTQFHHRSVAKNSHDYFTMLYKRTMRFP